MAYLKQQSPPEPIAAFARKNWLECRKILPKIKAPINTKHLYVGGVSRGGWLSAMISDERPDDLAGAAIFAAGMPSSQPGRGGKMKRAQRILLGVGETDENFMPTQRGWRYFRARGADVSYSEYSGKGHVYLPSASTLDWFRSVSARISPKNHEAYRADLRKRIKHAASLDSPQAKQAAQRRIWRSPIYKFRQSRQPSYGNPERDRLDDAYHKLFRKAEGNNGVLAPTDFHELKRLEAALAPYRNGQGDPGPPMFDSAQSNKLTALAKAAVQHATQSPQPAIGFGWQDTKKPHRDRCGF